MENLQTTQTDGGSTEQTAGATEQSTEQQTTEQSTEQTNETTEQTGEEKKPEGAPEKYEPFTLPEGVKDETGTLDRFAEFAKAKNLSQADAQELVDFYHKEVAARDSDRVNRQWEAQKTAWIEQAKTDAEIGGVNFDKNLAVAQRAIKTFATPELEETLSLYGMDKHPEMIRMFYWIGQQIKEDDRFVGNGNEPGNLSPQTRMKNLYPKTYQQQ